MPDDVHVQRSSAPAHAHSHGGEAVRMRSMWETLRPELPPEIAHGDALKWSGPVFTKQFLDLILNIKFFFNCSVLKLLEVKSSMAVNIFNYISVR